jgi:ADP-heptose:LPS heptosyltransferase/intein/homing endonuclease
MPTGRLTITCFSQSNLIHPLIPSCIKNDIGVVYICEKLPEDRIINKHIIYIEAPYRWFVHTLYHNPLLFSSVFASRESVRTAQAFSEFTGYKIPYIQTELDIISLSKNAESIKQNILVEVMGGVGDHLMTIPSLKTLDAKGFRVSLLCDAHRNPCYQNLPYVKTVYSSRREVDASKFSKIIMLNFGQQLNDYRMELNKQNRIYAVAALCGLSPDELVIDRPEIILTADEMNNARRKYGSYQNKIFLGTDSARVDAKIPSSMAQEKINILKSKGFTVFSASVRRESHDNCIDLNKKLSLRELFAVISLMDAVLTVDTSFLHIAAAFNKKTFCLLNYFKADWRCSTYPNCTVYTPRTSCYPCFPENTLITTVTGLKAIQDISVGDLVLTHRGNYRPVTKLFNKFYSGNLVGIKPQGWGDFIFSTPEHPYYDYDKKDWISAENLRVGNRLFRPSNLSGLNSFFYDLLSFCSDVPVRSDEKTIKQLSKISINNSRISSLPRFIPLDNDLSKLFGYYLSEGSLKDSVVRFTFHKNEKDYHTEALYLMKKVFGLVGSISESKYDKSVQIEFCSKIISKFFEGTCGRNTQKTKIKHIPREVWEASAGIKISLLRGFINGDADKKNKTCYLFGLTEKKLSLDIYSLCTSLGLCITFSERTQKSNDFHKNSWVLYRLCLSHRSLDYAIKKHNKLFYHKNGEYAIEISETKNFSGLVYNLEVAEDNSYCVNGYAVHNCVAKQFVASCDWQCHNKSCYEFFDWEKIFGDIYDFKLDKELRENERVKVIPNPEQKITTTEADIIKSAPGEIINPRIYNGKRIAAIWLGGVGDAIMLGYLCRAIADKYPGCQIDAYVRDAEQVALLAFDYPQIKACISKLSWAATIGQHKDNYDIIYEFRHYPYVWYKYDPSLNHAFDKELYDSWQKASVEILKEWHKPLFEYYALRTDLELTEKNLRMPFTPTNPKAVYSKLSSYNLPEKYITIAPGCDQNVGVIKLWSNDKWARLIQLLQEDGYRIVYLGNNVAPEVGNIKKVTCKNLIDMALILSQSQLHISNEGGSIHLAHAVGTRSLVLFGPTAPDLYGYSDNINLYAEKCPSCWWTVPNWSRQCKLGYKNCTNLQEISAEDVYEKVVRELS